MSSARVNKELDAVVLGQDPRDGRCGCGLAAIRAYLTLKEIADATTVGGRGVERFSQFPEWFRRHKEDFIEALEEAERECGVDIGPGSPTTPIIFRLERLDAFAQAHGLFRTRTEASQLVDLLFEALEKCE